MGKSKFIILVFISLILLVSCKSHIEQENSKEEGTITSLEKEDVSKEITSQKIIEETTSEKTNSTEKAETSLTETSTKKETSTVGAETTKSETSTVETTVKETSKSEVEVTSEETTTKADDETSAKEEDEMDSNIEVVQSKLMLEYTGKEWSKELKEDLQNVDFSQCNFDIKNPKMIKDVNSLFVLANKANYFPDDYVPINLVKPKSKHAGQASRRKMRKSAANAVDRLIKAAKEDGVDIRTVSGYRSIDTQRVLFKSYADREGVEKANKYSSKPGYSEHHTGLCVDVSSPVMDFGLDQSYGDTKEGKWLAENAHKYGFIIRYPKGEYNITGYIYEPWHIRYLGVPLATYLKETGLCYEEFIALQLGKMPDEIKISK